MNGLTFTVYGTPQPQGSKTITRWGGMRDANSEVLKPWRDTLATAASVAMGTRMLPMFGKGEAVHVTAWLSFKRPAAHYRTGKNSGVLKATAPLWHTRTPDADKCFRALGDALVAAGVLHDDAQIATVVAHKLYTLPGSAYALSIPGVIVTVQPLDRPVEDTALVADAATWPSTQE